MPKIRTFLDSGVLIAAATGHRHDSARALSIINDPVRAFAASIYVQLEVLPKAVYFDHLEKEAGRIQCSVCALLHLNGRSRLPILLYCAAILSYFGVTPRL